MQRNRRITITNKRQLGSRYEEEAAAYLIRQGMSILCRNYRCCFGEIDLIARDKGTIVFIEVKYRSSDKSGVPTAAVGIQKQKKICRSAVCFLTSAYNRTDLSCRFDVIGFEKDRLIHIKDAFSCQF